MRLSLRLILSLIFAVTLVSVLFALYQVQADRRARRNELEKRAQLMAESLQETVQPLLARGAQSNLQRIVERFGNRETAGRGRHLRCPRAAGGDDVEPGGTFKIAPAAAATRPCSKATAGVSFSRSRARACTSTPCRFTTDEAPAWALAVFHDASYIDAQNTKIWRDTFKTCSGADAVDLDHHVADRALEHGAAHSRAGAVAAGSSRRKHRAASGIFPPRTSSSRSRAK